MKTTVLLITTLIAPSVIFSHNNASAQEKHTISGYIRDVSSGEELIGATIYVQELKSGTASNIYGFYSLTLPNGSYTLHYSFVGYETNIQQVDLSSNKKINMELKERTTELKEVEVTAEKPEENVTSTEMSIVKLDIKKIKSLPVLFGEVDVLKTIQLMPGVMAAGEGEVGFYVRGGGPDQNLILLDEANVYNSSHLMGFFSVFNADAIKDVNLIKGGMPAQYGGRLSSVLDIKMKEGNSKKFGATGGIGLIASRLTLEGPIVKNKGSFIISGRRTYADLFLKLSSNEDMKNTRLYFYDLNLKTNYRFGEKDRVFLSGYFGRDVFKFSNTFGFDWGNATGTLRWNHLFSDKLFLNTSLIFSDFDYAFNIDFEGTEIKLISGIQDYNLKLDFNYFPSINHNVKFGINSIYHKFIPGELETNDESFNDVKLDKRHALEYAAYISDKQLITEKLSAEYGVRYSQFTLTGPGDIYKYDEEGGITDTTTYKSGELIKTYGGIEPRVIVTYMLNKRSSFKASYARTHQYLHMLSNTTSTSPTNLWVPSSTIVEPQIADQVALGYFRNFKENKYETSVEVYYKNLQNQIEYKNGADPFLNPIIESELYFGKGWSYGIELFIKKKYGELYGWLGYTLSGTNRKFDDIDDGKVFPARYDRTHDVSFVLSYDLNKKWKLSTVWVFATGNAVTFPVGKYEYDGKIFSLYTERNQYRMPAYHRLDLSATYQGKKREKFQSSWNFSIYNVYARENAYMISFRQNEDNPEITEAVKLSLFTIIPSVAYNFKF
ncbi:hypothetical protein ES705_12987 [subsurface metagenome]